MDLLAQVLVNGVLLGGLYALMALGLALVWGVLNIVNLAHGAFIMLGALSRLVPVHGAVGIDPFLGAADHRDRHVRARLRWCSAAC